MFPSFPFIGSPHYTPVAGKRAVSLIVLHDMEAPEKGDTAEGVARYFQTPGLNVSSHYCIDNDSVVQCVALNNVAWCAPGANSNGIHLEHAGYARQSRNEWLDAYGIRMLDLSAKLTAALCHYYGLPPAFVDHNGIVRASRGITTHAEVTRAYPERGDGHWDPGPGFPIDYYISLVKKYYGSGESDTGWPVPIPKWFWAWAAWKLQGSAGKRPTAPYVIPAWAWRRLIALKKARKG